MKPLRFLAAFALVALVVVVYAGCSAVGPSPYNAAAINPGVAPGSAKGGNDSQARELLEPGMGPSLEDEVWVIARPDDAAPATPNPDLPGQGALVIKKSETEIVPVPLKHTNVSASVLGHIATVDVTQQFHNPFSEKIEAVYVFPLPHNAAVNDFLMTIGGRRIRGIIRDRQEATKIYQEAKAQGYKAALLTQERPNIFTQSVANIEPGKDIDIDIKYFNTLSYVDGAFEFVFPMVVAPRYNGAPAILSALAPKEVAEPSSVIVTRQLAPGQRSGHDISLTLTLQAGVNLESISSTSHQVHIDRLSESAARISLDPSDTLPNKDFVLRYKVAGGQLKSTLLAQHGAEGEGYFTLMVVPPATDANLARSPLEFVFVIDTSGSQAGAPIAQSKAAVRCALQRLLPTDTFQVVRFANTSERLNPSPLPATPANVARALAFVDGLAADGGTELEQGVKAALDFPHDPARLRFVIFMTDGQIGDERTALNSIHELLGPSRIFSFGCGASTNRFLLDEMAILGRGAVAHLLPNDNAEDVMKQFFDRVEHPVLTDVHLDLAGAQSIETYPRQLPDLFVGRPLVVSGKFTGRLAGAKVVGSLNGRQVSYDIKVMDAPAPARLDNALNPATSSLAALWARAKIADLARASVYRDNPGLNSEVRSLALQYGLLSPFTAFLAVDASAITAGDHGVTVQVPLPAPEGQPYSTAPGANH